MIARKTRATMHGAVSIVNAIATGNGSSLGISLRVNAEVELARGHGVRFLTGKNDDRLVNNIIRNTGSVFNLAASGSGIASARRTKAPTAARRSGLRRTK